MYLAVIMVISIAVAMGMIAVNPSQLTAESQATPDMQIDQYRLFMYASNAYMAGTPTSVTSPTAVYWADLKGAAGVSPAAKNMVLPSTWKLVRSQDNSWVTCTEMDATSIASLATRVATPGVVAVAGMEVSVPVKNPATAPSSNLNITPISATPPLATPTVSTLGGQPVTHHVVGDSTTAPALAALCL